MDFELEHAGEVTAFTLEDGEHRVGGAEEDAVRVEGLPPSALVLRVEGARVVAEAPGVVRIGGVRVPTGVARLWVEGEEVELPGDVRLRRAGGPSQPHEPGTLALLRGLLSGEEGPAPGGTAALRCLTGPDTGRTYVLGTEATEAGRGEDVQVRLRDRAVSRRHARFTREGPLYAVEDLGGANGLRVDGRRVRRRTTLSHGAVVELGRTLLRFEEPADGPAAPAEDPDDTPGWPRAVGTAALAGVVVAGAVAAGVALWL